MKVAKNLKKTEKNKLIFTFYLLIIFLGMARTYFKDTVETFSMPLAKKIIVIDAGHGGFDPGKVSKNNILEKDINLNISKKLQSYLEQSGAFVLTTRIDDKALSDKKRQDLKERKHIANSEDVDLLISVHQNSFPKENVKGAQIFYYNTSEESKNLAENIQKRLKELDNTNNREAKPNSDYYLLKQTSIPSVIVECGFLSNLEENKKLNSEEYQEKIAWSIYLGVLDYYKEL